MGEILKMNTIHDYHEFLKMSSVGIFVMDARCTIIRKVL